VRVWRLWLLAALAGPLGLLWGPGLWALKAAGLRGVAPAGGAAFAALVRGLEQNWTWLVSTGLGLVLVLIAGLMVSGSRQAPDWLFRVIGGIMLILVVIPAVLA
jgi:hypothetical protein